MIEVMGSIARMLSLASGILFGGVFGVYLSQTYQLPDVKRLGTQILEKSDQYIKDDSKGETD